MGLLKRNQPFEPSTLLGLPLEAGSLRNTERNHNMKKSLNVTSVADAKQGKVNDIQVVGNGDTFRLLCKASSKEQGWMKSAKAAQIEGVGCLVQVTTQQGEHVAEALTFVPGVRIEDDINGGRKLVKA